MGYAISGPYLENWLRKHPLDVLVSVHPMVNQYMVKALKATGLYGKVKLVTVITDPNGEFWRGWACPEADLSIVPNDLGKNQLIEWGVAPEKIRVMGMPVNADFIKPPTVKPAEFRQHLSLSPDRPTVCINAGWAGGGNMLHIYRELQNVSTPVQAIFLCGHNRALYEMAKKEAKLSPIPTAVLPFHDRMPDLMAAVDLMVTKAGGLTTFEAIARKLPMAIDMITPPMPQEAGTVQIIIEQGLARGVRTPSDIIEIVEQLQPVADRSRLKLPAAHSLDKIDAVYEISNSIIQYCERLTEPTGDQTSTVERH
jgi:UDP-N-acetylglucosamine:LPS N-acetylglucosamine transferase